MSFTRSTGFKTQAGHSDPLQTLICSFPQINFLDKNAFYIVLIVHDALLFNCLFAAM